MPLKQVLDRDYVHDVESFWCFVWPAARIFADYVK
jgi:hypothetical protein